MTTYYYLNSSGTVLADGEINDPNWATYGYYARLDSDTNPGYENGMAWNFSTTSWYYTATYLNSYLLSNRDNALSAGQSFTWNGNTINTDIQTISQFATFVERARIEDSSASRAFVISFGNPAITLTNAQFVEFYDAALLSRQALVDSSVTISTEITAGTITDPTGVDTAVASALSAAAANAALTDVYGDVGSKANTSDMTTALAAKADASAVTSAISTALSALSIPAAQVQSDWSASSGVAAIANKPTIPTAVSAFTNDANYMSATAVATSISTAVNNLINSAPGTMDTLGEIAAFITADETTAAALASTVSGKASSATTVNGHALTSNVTVSASDVGLGNVNNTADSAKPVSSAQATAIAAKPDVYFGSTKQTTPKFYANSATVASGVAVFQMTTDGTSTGSAIFTTPNLASLNYYVNDATASYQVSAALSNSNKTLTLTTNKLTTANILSGILGQAAANGASVSVALWGS